MRDLACLVLNQSYEPLNVCLVRRALTLIFNGKAEMVENGSGYIYTARASFPVPTVIRLSYLIKRPFPQPRLTRSEIFHRDHYTCQYCGKKNSQLTIDHVVPRNQNGKHTWENLVTACAACNRRKAGRTPEQAHMKLLKKPVRPSSSIFCCIPYHYLETQINWRKYISGNGDWNRYLAVQEQ
jgi:5-methylcytosine-specific restriction endonuclease McrA